MANERILVVEDELDILELVKYNLIKSKYSVLTAETGEGGISQATSGNPDLILLDLMLPGIDGLEVCKALKSGETTRNIPIIMVTAKSEETDIITGLELGADDYITKPFSTKVMIARIKASLRRNQINTNEDSPSIITRGTISIDTDKYEVRVESEKIELTKTEFNVLKLFIKRPGRVFTRYQIVDATKGDNYIVTDRAVDVQIVGLRKKLGIHGKQIKTVRGIGYKFEEQL